MTIYLDTADLEIITENIDKHFCGGITTNPSILSKINNLDYFAHLKKIKQLCKKYNKSLSIEVTTNDKRKILKEALKIKKKYNFRKLHIKIPVSHDNLSLISNMHRNKIKVNVTCVFTLAQAYLSADSFGDYISIFYNRTKDLGEDPIKIIKNLRKYIDNHNLKSKIIVGSIRSRQDVEDGISSGAHIITVPPKIYTELFENKGTTNSINQFLDDIKKIQKGN